jgi:hypothetical protein
MGDAGELRPNSSRHSKHGCNAAVPQYSDTSKRVESVVDHRRRPAARVSKANDCYRPIGGKYEQSKFQSGTSPLGNLIPLAMARVDLLVEHCDHRNCDIALLGHIFRTALTPCAVFASVAPANAACAGGDHWD